MTDPIGEANRAAQTLAVLEPVFEQVKAAIVDKLLATSPSNQADIIALHASAQVVDAVRLQFIAIIGAGQVAAAAAEADASN